MTIDERISFLETYINEFETSKNWCYGNYSIDYLEACKKLKVLGFEWGDNIKFDDFEIIKGYYITNPTTNFQGDKDRYYIHWDNGNIGRLMFVTQEYWFLVEEEWTEFNNILKSYAPLDWDEYNCHMIFDVEHGKKLISDYKDIKKKIYDKMKVKIKQIELEKAKKEYEKLLAETKS